jgi:ribonuclease VapC
MTAVDTSALMAIVLREAEADRCKAALEVEPDLLISAKTVAEALIVTRAGCSSTVDGGSTDERRHAAQGGA